ncbi:hypothetical protein BD289DRAFT_480898 [Coniella lustricola]|uniref:Uncharacterized protein n=1 Tax=Coniella lustricola TaxID=2025994 RepID=A0A2T3ADW2_9PEZI|nr:hypothetical protein BD289DRAFT_480898 [Coniella lustricola]
MPPRNGDIRNFFGGPQASLRPSAQQQPPPTPVRGKSTAAAARNTPPRQQTLVFDSISVRHTTPPPNPHVSAADTSSIASSPPSAAQPRQAFARDAVIAASDDEDFDSDGSDLIDITCIGGPSRPAPGTASTTGAASPGPSNIFDTPRAKRTLTNSAYFFSSPLTIQSKKKKYDLAALLEYNKKDEETAASAKRFEALWEGEKKRLSERKNGSAPNEGMADSQSEEQAEKSNEEDGEITAQQLKKQMIESAAAPAGDDDEEGKSKLRVVRALERADVRAAGSTTYYFFEQTEPKSDCVTVQNTFPKAQAQGVWEILGDTQDRSRHFQSGFPVDVQEMFGNLPDEIFLWILNEVCHEGRGALAIEYVKLLTICNEQVHRLLTPDLIQQLFRTLGATKDVENLTSPATLRDEVGDPYRSRSWTCLENLLGLLGNISTSLTVAAQTTTMQILLRLGMDHLAIENFGLTHEWRRAADCIARSVPRDAWSSFCRDVCSSIYYCTKKAALRWRAITILGPVMQAASQPTLQTVTLDLKRRLASVFFFDQLSLAEQRPEDTVSIAAVIESLHRKEFAINGGTDYDELHALMRLLNTTLGDASKQQHVTTPEESQRFDALVDELAEDMRNMLTRVAPQNKGIHVSRIEAKSAMEMIRERLLFQVRTKKKPKIKGIRLDDPEESEVMLKQRDFMKDFFLNKDRNRFKNDETAMPSIETMMT